MEQGWADAKWKGICGLRGLAVSDPRVPGMIGCAGRVCDEAKLAAQQERRTGCYFLGIIMKEVGRSNCREDDIHPVLCPSPLRLMRSRSSPALVSLSSSLASLGLRLWLTGAYRLVPIRCLLSRSQKTTNCNVTRRSQHWKRASSSASSFRPVQLLLRHWRVLVL
jgi:hypothetical protein